MKFKIMDKEPIYLAGVVHYGPLQKGQYSHSGKSGSDASHFDEDEEFKKNINDLKANARHLKDQIKDEMKFHKDHFSHDYRDHRRRWKQAAKTQPNDSKIVSGIIRDGEESRDRDEHSGSFEGAMNRFGEAMRSFGRYMEENAPKWEAGIKDWSDNFEKDMEHFGEKMENWGENIGEKMEAWGEDFGKRMEEWGESFADKWDREMDESNEANAIRRYPIYRTYEEVYDRHIQNHPDHIKKQTFYEVQIMDASFENVTTMVMIGSRMSDLNQLRYPVATMRFEPDSWAAVKLTPEEYSRDWLGSLEKVPQLKAYVIEPYFIVRHRRVPETDEIRIFCPLRKKTDER